jgi:molecular chaperone GrpE
LGSEEQHRRHEESLEDEPSSEEGLSMGHERGESGAATAEGGSVFESPEASGAENPGVVREANFAAAEEGEPETGGETEEGGREGAPALSRELEDVRRERDEYLENMRRMKAEFDNSRTRLEREHARSVELASERLVKELLPILDNLERALEAEGDVREGVEATRNQLVDILAEEGLNPISSEEGQSFDPAVHEALMSKPSDEHEEDTVIQTLERGYVLKGKPIRPAKVVVSRRA